jgi:ubiquinone/menaquinone biosynthesis C-methylase UbiE
VTSNHFDEKAATWDDDPAKVERAEVVARAIVQRVRPSSGTRLLEYGAGTGLVTQAMQEAVGPVTLADTSAGMRQVMADKIAAGLLPAGRLWDVDLAVDPTPDAEFDLIVTVLTLHHIHDVPAALAAFARLLVPGGHLCVVDLVAEDGSFHGEGFDGHHGFEQGELTAQLEEAGFTDVTHEICHHMERDGISYPIFLVTGVRGR